MWLPAQLPIFSPPIQTMDIQYKSPIAITGLRAQRNKVTYIYTAFALSLIVFSIIYYPNNCLAAYSTLEISIAIENKLYNSFIQQGWQFWLVTTVTE